VVYGVCIWLFAIDDDVLGGGRGSSSSSSSINFLCICYPYCNNNRITVMQAQLKMES
jgi:hypothetical protein